MTDILAQSIRQAVRKPEVIEALCASLEAQLRAQLGGQQHRYIAKRSSSAERAERIRAGFTGDNYAELAKAEGITPRRVRQILDRKAKKAQK